MKTLKSLIGLIAIVSLFSNKVSAQIYNPDLPVIEPFTIEVKTINEEVGDTGKHLKLYENGGHVTLPPTYYKTTKGKSLGIIIVQDFTYSYHAYEVRCPHCFYDNDEEHKVIMATTLSARCTHCSAQMENIINWGSGQLTCYDHGSLGPRYLDAYRVKVRKEGRKTYLDISNTACAYPN